VIKRGANTYQTQQIMTASPVMLVAMLYDKAIQSLKKAIVAIDVGDIQTRWSANNRAFEIIQHLQRTLDRERGGEVAANLDALYGHMLCLLPQVNMKNDRKAAKDVIELLEPLRDSWRQAATNMNAQTPPLATSAPKSFAERTVVSA
jgi:flagellar secretion chaperone FliS